MGKNRHLEPNFSLLLAPIGSQNPTGEALRYTDVYDQIREARREDDDNLPQGVWKSEIKKADWDQVDRLCQDALKNRSKDIQIAAWLTEAWLHLEGMGGLSRGIDLILKLTRTYWDTLYPQMNGEGYEHRTPPYEWINTRLSEEAQWILISMPSDRAALPYRLLDLNEANRIEFSSKKNKPQGVSQPQGGKSLSLANVSLSIDQTPTAFYHYMDESCVTALQRMAELEEELRTHLGGEAPGFYRLREKIEITQRFSRHVLSKRGEKKGEKKVMVVSELAPSPLKKIDLGSIENREQAYAILGDVAAYLERIEPHSPTPYLIRRAMTWGGMSLSELVSDTINKGNDMTLLLDILNIKKEG
ncbi:MAG: type VI secretion system protein TssA [Alphaproteobacteria bacterium]|nr:type VI secretion system protein TssA [Alphaproteobacteria bacterium]